MDWHPALEPKNQADSTSGSGPDVSFMFNLGGVRSERDGLHGIARYCGMMGLYHSLAPFTPVPETIPNSSADPWSVKPDGIHVTCVNHVNSTVIFSKIGK